MALTTVSRQYQEWSCLHRISASSSRINFQCHLPFVSTCGKENAFENAFDKIDVLSATKDPNTVIIPFSTDFCRSN